MLDKLESQTEEIGSSEQSSEYDMEQPVEELPLERRVKMAEKFDFFKFVKQGDFLDAQDTINMWCMATVEEVLEGGKLLVHYDGWSSKWDQRFHTFQSGVAPFRKHTRGYTGQQKYALRNNMQLEPPKLKEFSDQLLDIVKADFESFETAFELTQILRGRLYVTIDFLMSYDYKTDSEEMEAAHGFLKTFIRVIVAWLKKIPTLLVSISELIQHPEIYLVDRKAALCACMPDFVDLLNKVFCNEPRTIRYYETADLPADNDGAATEFTLPFDNSTVKNIDSSRAEMPYLDATVKRTNKQRGCKIRYGKLHTYFNLLCAEGGLDAIVNLVKAADTASKTGGSAPLDFIVSLTSSFKKLGDMITPECAKTFVLALKDSIFKRLDSVDDREMKDIDKDLVTRTLRNMKEFLMLHFSQDEANKMIDTTELLMALRFLKTPYMEKRLKGLNEIKAIVEKVSQKAGLSTGSSKDKQSRRYPQHYYSSYSSYSYGDNWGYNNYQPTTTWIDAPFLIQWIQDSQLLDILLHPENTHAEILKRTSAVLRFLAQNQALDTSTLDKLWACQEGGKHEAIVNAVLQLVTDIASTLSLEHLNMLYKRIATTPLEQVDDAFITFLKDFSKNAIQATVAHYKKAGKPSSLEEPENPQQGQGQGQGDTGGEPFRHPDVPGMQDEDKYNNNYDDNQHRHQSDDDFGEVDDETNKILSLCLDPETGAIRKDVLAQFESPSAPEAVAALRACRLAKQAFGVPYLWSMMQDESHVLSEDTALQAQTALQEILGETQCSDLRLFYYLKAMNNMQEFKSIVTSFGLAKSILNIETPEGYAPSHAHKDYHPLLTKLNQHSDILGMAVTQIERYMKHVRGVITEGQENARAAVFLSKYSHQKTLESMLHFIDFCVTRARHCQNITLGEDMLQRLWEFMVKGANHQADAEIFLSWLQTAHEVSHYTTVPLISGAERKFLFNHVLASHMADPGVSMTFFQCFHKFFKDINREEFNIEVTQPSKYYSSYSYKPRQDVQPTITVLRHDSLIGLDSLWSIAFVAQDDSVRKAAIGLLVDLHLRISQKEQYSSHYTASYITKPKTQDQKQIWTNFIAHCMEVLKDSLNQMQDPDLALPQREALSRSVDTSLSCLAKFLDGHLAASVSQGVDIYQNNKNAMQNPIQLELEPDSIHKTFHLPYTCTFHDIRVAVQRCINAPTLDEFSVLTKKGKPLAASDDEVVKTYHLTTLYIHRVQKKRNLLEELEQMEREAAAEKKKEEEEEEPIEAQAEPMESSEEEDYNYNAMGTAKKPAAKLAQAEPSEHPKYLISKEPGYIELLVRLLEMGDGYSFIKTAWDLLMKLPVSRKLALELRDLEGAGLEDLLPLNSIHKMLYSLQIVRELAEAEESTKAWGTRFLSKGGLEHLLKAVELSHVDSVHSALQVKYFSNLLTLVLHFSEKYSEGCQELIAGTKPGLTEKILRLLSAVSEYTIEKEEEQLRKEAEAMTKGLKTPLKKASSRQVSPLRKRRKPLRRAAAIQLESAGMDMGAEDEPQQQQPKMTSAQKWGMGEDDDSDEDEFERADDPLVLEATEEAQIFQCAMRFLFLAPNAPDGSLPPESVALVSKIIQRIFEYEDLEELLSASLLRSANYKIRQEMAVNFQQLFKLGDSASGSLVGADAIPAAFQLKKRVLNLLVQQLLPQVFEQADNCDAFFELLGFVFAEMPRAELEKMFVYEGVGDEHEADSLVFLRHVANLIINRESNEFSQNDVDAVLVGLLNLARSVLSKYPEYKDRVGMKQGLVQDLLLKCLFDFPTRHAAEARSSVTPPPKCKSQESRNSAFGLLLQLVQDCPINLQHTVLSLLPFHRNNSWRTRRKADWEIYPQQSEKSSTGFVGLKNLGCICYLNSVMQQLFMIESFRNDILACPDPQREEKKVPDEDNVLLQVQLLFGALRMSEKMYFNPQGFCHAFKDWEGQPINVLEQMDADQFFNMLMDRLEGLVKGSPQEQTINQHFGGKVANEIICKDCPHFSEREEPFMNVALQVKGKKTVQESLEAYVTGDLLEGDNAFFCDKCDKKVAALKRACIKRLPRTLVLALKRFEYNFDTMQRVKCNDYCEFPMELDMEPYTQEGLKRLEKQKEKEKRRREAEAAGEEFEEGEEEEPPKKYPDEYYKYKLAGVVIHIGTAESGHYYSLINDRQPHLRGNSKADKWYEFNDTRVTPFEASDIPNEAFGGEETWTSSYYSTFSNYSMKSEKMRNGYLLLYERVNPWEPPADEEEERIKKAEKKEGEEAAAAAAAAAAEPELERTKSVVKGGMLQYIFEEMEIENLRYWYNRFLFSREYQVFVEHLAANWSSHFQVPKHCWTKNQSKLNYLRELADKGPLDWLDGNAVNHNFSNIQADPIVAHLVPKAWETGLEIEEQMEHELLVFRFFASYFLVVLIRTKQRHVIPAHLDIFKSYLNRNYKCASWLLNQLSHPKLIRELLFECPIDDMREFVAGVIECAIQRLYPIEKDKLNNYWTAMETTPLPELADADEFKFDPTPPRSVPMTSLGNFMNALLSQYDAAKQFSYHTSQFFKIFAKFSLLGNEAIDYLIRARTVGRLLDLYTQYQVNEQNVAFRDTRDLLYFQVADKEVEFGLPISVNMAVLSSWDQFFIRKREKSVAERFGNLAYLWQTISRLIRSSDAFPANSKYALRSIGEGKPYHANLKPVAAQLTESEKQLFLTVTKNQLKRIFEEGGVGGCMIGTRELGMLFGHICWDNFDNSNIVLGQLVVGINEKDYDGIQPFLVPYKYMLSLDDTLQEERTLEFMNQFTKLLRENRNYAKLTRSLITTLIKFARKFPQVQSYLRENEQKLKWIFDWIRNTFQNAQYQYSSSAMSQTSRRQLQADRIELDSVMHETPEEEKELRQVYQDKQWDSDDDMADELFYIGQKVDYYEGQSYTEAEVLHVLDEMLQVASTYYGTRRHMWVRLEENKVMPLGCRTKGENRVTYPGSHKSYLERTENKGGAPGKHEADPQHDVKIPGVAGGHHLESDDPELDGDDSSDQDN